VVGNNAGGPDNAPVCGIVGRVDFRGREIDESLLARMTEAVAHRGPDGTSTRILRCGPCSVGLGFARLAVIDTSARAGQPMSADLWRETSAGIHPDPDAPRWIVFNGEIYNYRELRRDLVARGARFRSQSDTEVLLRAYLHWGEKAFERFNGMWALAVIDERTGEGLLSRDRFGIKPLFYTCGEGLLSFASEIAPLLMLPELQRRVDPQGLDLFLRLGYLPGSHSLVRGVQRLLPGHHLRFTADGPGEPQRYYRIPANDPGDTSDYEECAHALRRRIEQAVTNRMVADVPLGAFLSGGVDSSIIVAHLAENASGRIKTFSIGFAYQPRYDETRYARRVARHFGTEHYEYKLTSREVLKELPALLDHLGEPFGDSSLLPTALLSMHTRKQVTVALSGDGGDELFAGYRRYAGHHYLRRYLSWPGWLRRRVIEPLVNLLPASRSGPWSNRLRQVRKTLRAVSTLRAAPEAIDPLEAHLAWAQILDPEFADLFAEPTQFESGVAHLIHLLRSHIADGCNESIYQGDAMNEILAADLLVGLPGDMLHKVDLASSRYGLEVRVPLLDPDVVRLVASLPSTYKLVGSRGKRILTDAYRGLLPDDILERSKMGFELPVGEWLRDELRPMFTGVVTREAIESIGSLNYGAVTRAYEQHTARRADHTELLYSLLSLCWWWKRQQ
jgi:asparagine synthase (glutamine-hydrolysing)